MCQILYWKLTQIDKQSLNSTFSTLPQGDHALSGHAQKYHDCSLWVRYSTQTIISLSDNKNRTQFASLAFNAPLGNFFSSSFSWQQMATPFHHAEMAPIFLYFSASFVTRELILVSNESYILYFYKYAHSYKIYVIGWAYKITIYKYCEKRLHREGSMLWRKLTSRMSLV